MSPPLLQYGIVFGKILGFEKYGAIFNLKSLKKDEVFLIIKIDVIRSVLWNLMRIMYFYCENLFFEKGR